MYIKHIITVYNISQTCSLHYFYNVQCEWWYYVLLLGGYNYGVYAS